MEKQQHIWDNILGVLSLLFILIITASCNDSRELSYNGICEEYYTGNTVEELKTNSVHIRENILALCKMDNDSALADNYVKSYYRNHGSFLWIDRYGISSQTDTLLAFLDTIAFDGFSTKKIKLDILSENVKRINELTFNGDSKKDINESLAFAEYYLTKAMLRCGTGMRYGIINPHKIFNNIDVRDSDSVAVTYRQLFDIPVEGVNKNRFENALEHVRKDNISSYLREATPKDPLYQQLKNALKTASGTERDKILVNMERVRWRTSDAPFKNEEYVIVNIPAYHLWAVNKDKTIDMKIGCGSTKTKTPLLYSKIERMDINPQWVIPHSITSKEIIHHAGDGNYFTARRYFAQNKKTGEKLYGDNITYNVLASNDYYLVQEGGEGNSLGRIIFRFKNNFAIYLHDTSSRHFFANSSRSVSHGCIRVERPYDLAEFLLRGNNSDIAEKIKYSMENDIKADGIKKNMLVNSVKIEPPYPVFITYYTIFLTPDGKLETYPDVYGYDTVMLPLLKGRL